MRRREFRFQSDINIANLVDVILVLLIIFMVTAPMLQSGLDVRLPKSKLSPQEERQGIVVTLKKDGDLYIDKYPVSSSQFLSKLKAAVSHKRVATVYLKADERVKYGLVIDVMGKIREAGIEDVGLVTEPEVRRR